MPYVALRLPLPRKTKEPAICTRVVHAYTQLEGLMNRRINEHA